MSELQTALLAIGLGVIVVIYLLGWWQQRQYSRKYGAAFKPHHSDALYQESVAVPARHESSVAMTVPLDSSKLEPSAHEPVTHEPIVLDFGSSPTLAAVPPESHLDQALAQQANEQPEPSKVARKASNVIPVPAHDADLAELSVVTPSVLDESCALLDVRSDFIIELQLAEPSPAAVLDGFWQRKFDFAKPVQVCGLTLQTGQWERAIADSQILYTRFKISLQLVDRGGAISPTKLSDFRDLVLGIAKSIKAECSVPDVSLTHAEAVKLDTLCASVDQMVGVNLVPPGERVLLGKRLEQAANLYGLTLQSDGAFHTLNGQGNSLFTLISLDTKPFQHHTLENSTSSGVTLLLDVPRVESPAQQFDQMMHVAHALAKELQVNVVDDQRVLLNAAGIALIRAQIVAVETKMVVNGIMPGSPQARRLFS